MRSPILLVTLAALLVPTRSPAQTKKTPGHPLTEKARGEIRKKWQAVVKDRTKRIAAEPNVVAHYSGRGDAYFFLGRFSKAVADYEKMVQLNPRLKTMHWRRGIACFYAGQFKKAAHQFEIYNTFDNVDRENGIWRFFSQAKAYGLKKARRNLLKYKTDDREPFPDVYKLFSKTITPPQILKHIEAAKIDRNEQEKRFFYANLYIGLNHALEGRRKPAVKYLREAVANSWGPKAGFGPNYMWHVGRLHYNLLTAKQKKP